MLFYRNKKRYRLLVKTFLQRAQNTHNQIHSDCYMRYLGDIAPKNRGEWRKNKSMVAKSQNGPDGESGATPKPISLGARISVI